MKGIRFYHETKLPMENGFGSVFALCLDHLPYYHEGFSGVQDYPNCPVNWGSASQEYLRENCKRISEFKARRLHPEIFHRLDDVNDADFKTKERCKMRFWSFLCLVYFTFKREGNAVTNQWKLSMMEKIADKSKSLGVTIVGGFARETSVESFDLLVKAFEKDDWTFKDFV